MPTKIKNLKKEKRKIILDIIFENIIPTTSSNMFWSLDMLTAETRRHNIDDGLRINKYDIKRIVISLSKTNDKVDMHLINSNIYFTFS